MVDPHIMLVPIVGFYENCNRIGQGGGFYDRTIQKLFSDNNGKILTIGVALEAQKFDNFEG